MINIDLQLTWKHCYDEVLSGPVASGADVWGGGDADDNPQGGGYSQDGDVSQGVKPPDSGRDHLHPDAEVDGNGVDQDGQKQFPNVDGAELKTWILLRMIQRLCTEPSYQNENSDFVPRKPID